MKKILIICLFFITSNIFAQLNIYPNETTVPAAAEFLVWDNATVNITMDNLQNQVSDSTFKALRNITALTGSTVGLNNDQLFLSTTITGNTTYNLTSVTKTGVVSLIIYSASAYSVGFTFSGGSLYAPYSESSFTTEADSYTVIQFIIPDITHITVLWQPGLTQIN